MPDQHEMSSEACRVVEDDQGTVPSNSRCTERAKVRDKNVMHEGNTAVASFHIHSLRPLEACYAANSNFARSSMLSHRSLRL